MLSTYYSTQALFQFLTQPLSGDMINIRQTFGHTKQTERVDALRDQT